MSPEDVSTAPARRPLRARSLVAIRADLAARPAALLADTLRALLASESWVEQETSRNEVRRGLLGLARDRVAIVRERLVAMAGFQMSTYADLASTEGRRDAGGENCKEWIQSVQ